jgi:hypothetical protein
MKENETDKPWRTQGCHRAKGAAPFGGLVWKIPVMVFFSLVSTSGNILNFEQY